MGHVEVGHLSHTLPDGRMLLNDASFRVGEGTTAALVGPNGSGKTTLIRLIAGDLTPQSGTVAVSGGLGVMRQFIGGFRGVAPPGEQSIGGFREAAPPGEQSISGFQGVPQAVSGPGNAAAGSGGRASEGVSLGGASSVRDLLVSVAQPRVRRAAARLDAAELAMMERDDEPTQLGYAKALADWGDAGGYDAEVLWDACCVAALGTSYHQTRWRDVKTLSGGEQKRLVLEALFRGTGEVLLLDEPDNYLDVPGKRWLEQRLAESPKSVLLVSHDRELLLQPALARDVEVVVGLVEQQDLGRAPQQGL
jgi:ATPase subunit of ABC transporter with duplicated ATPase domains